MREILDYCKGAVQRQVPAGTVLITEGSTTGHLFVLIEGQLEVLRGDHRRRGPDRARRSHRRNERAARDAAYGNGAHGRSFDAV